jgi:hypothetical protein
MTSTKRLRTPAMSRFVLAPALKGGDPSLLRIAGLHGEEIGNEHEAGSVSAQKGELSDGVGHVSLADAGGPQKDAVGLSIDNVEGGGIGRRVGNSRNHIS